MTKSRIFVFDTNALISAFLVKDSISDKAFKKAADSGVLGISDPLLTEFLEVLWRPKFDKYFDAGERENIVAEIIKYAVYFQSTEKIKASTDPDDNMILELAISSHADCIISGDPHLRILHPFQGIPIISPAGFLDFQ